MKKHISLLILAGALLPLTSFAFNADAGENINLSSTISDDYYVAAGNININAEVIGDICAAGGKIFINKNINHDLMSIGGEHIINGNIGESARILATNIIIESTIEKDLLVGAGNITIKKNSTIKGETKINAGNVVLDGTTNNTEINAENVSINGIINGNAIIRAQNIKYTTGAKILGNLSYQWPYQDTGLEQIVAGQITFKQTNYEHKDYTKIIGGFTGTRFAFLFVFGLILLLVGYKRVQSSIKTIKTHARESLAYGFLVYAALPIATLLLAISIIGIPFAFITTVTFISLLIFYKLLNVYFYSNLLIEQWGGHDTLNNRKKIWILFGCALLSSILSTVDIIFAFFALGAIIKTHIIKKK